MGSMQFTADIQQLEPGSVIQLIEIDGTEFGMDQVLRFHAHNIQEEEWAAFSPQKICPPLSGRETKTSPSLRTEGDGVVEYRFPANAHAVRRERRKLCHRAVS